MTVAELIAVLQTLPPDALIVDLATPRDAESVVHVEVRLPTATFTLPVIKTE